MLDQLALGLGQIATLSNLLVLLLGLVVGMLVAILPGLTLVMGVALALPFTYAMGMAPAVILLTAMYVSGTYGGAFTSILFRVPGEPFDIPLLWDGHAMARAGGAAKALGLVLLAALVGGFLSLLFMVAVAEPFARFAVRLSSAEFFALILFGIASVVSLGGGSLVNALIALCVGLLVASVGVDQTYGVDRYSFGLRTLSDGIEYVAVMIGAYGLGEVLSRTEAGMGTSSAVATGGRIRTVLPSFAEALRLRWALLRSTGIGILVGIVPGAGATVASFVAYGAEGQYGARRRQLGSGIEEGIVAPQAASTASVGGAMTSLLTLGIPGSGTTAILYGALLLHDVQPGPQLFLGNAEVPYTIFATMLVSLIGMCLVGYLFIRALMRVLEAPEVLVAALVVAFCFVGTLAVRNSVNDLWVIVAFGAVGWLFERYRLPLAPMVLGVILGPMAEGYFMTTMIAADNDWTVFLTRPLSATLLAASALSLAVPVLREHWRRRSHGTPEPARS
ncbi:MAG: tripartite tricarboxylate transporter permease [Geminicoccaceae bacterium]